MEGNEVREEMPVYLGAGPHVKPLPPLAIYFLVSDI